MKRNTTKYFYNLPEVEKHTKYSFADNLDKKFRFESNKNRFVVDTSLLKSKDSEIVDFNKFNITSKAMI